MKKDNKYKLKQIFSYLGGKLTGKDKNAFEKEVQKDPFLEDAIEGLSMLSTTEMDQDISSLNKRLIRHTGSSNKFILYRVAAALAILVFVSSLFVALIYYTNQITDKSEIAVLETESREEDKYADEISPPDPLLFMEAPALESEKKQSKPLPLKESKTVESPIVFESEMALESIARIEKDKLQIESAQKTEELAVASRQAQASPSAADLAFAPAGPEQYISGVVLSADDSLPLPGASIVFKGSKTGVVTDFEGRFRLNVSDNQENTLIASFIGMKTLEIKPDSTKEMEVLLEPDLLALDEVVVTGYGTRKRSAVTGASQTISYDDLYLHPDFKPAVPVTGNREFTNYINSNARFPENTDLKRAVVVLSFNVDTSGRPKNISVLRSPETEFSNEAIRLLNEGPDWYPANLGDKIIEVLTQIRMVLKK